MKCIKCGKEMLTSFSNGDNVCFECRNSYNNSHTHIPNYCDMPVPPSFGEQKGWICPVCGRGVAPWMNFCPCQSDWEITYGTSAGDNSNVDMNDSLKYATEHLQDLDKKMEL